MSTNTKIEWCDHTFNPWIGCTKVSPGCANCYAEALMDTRYGKARWGKGQPRVRTSPANWRLPLKWNRGPLVCGKCERPFVQLTGKQKLCEPIPGDPCHHCNFGVYRRPRVFCASLADWLDDEVPIEWLADLFELTRQTPNIDWLMLTKRPWNFWARIAGALAHVEGIKEGEDWPDLDPNTSVGVMLNNWHAQKHPANIWIGASVEDQHRADERIPALLKIPARVRFLSVEPMLGSIEFPDHLGWKRCHCGARGLADCHCFPIRNLHWVIFGGESGPGARPCNIEWLRDGVRQCRAAGVAPFVKQLGGNLSDADLEECSVASRVSMHDKKGGDMSEWPEDLRIREFPT